MFIRQTEISITILKNLRPQKSGKLFIKQTRTDRLKRLK